jgi:pyruvate kinase
VSAPAIRRTKIVATLGPSTDHDGVLRAIFDAGVDVVRLNFSHGTQDTHGARLAKVRRTAHECGRVVAALQDLQGPKIRIGALASGRSVPLDEGARFVITTDDVPGTEERVSTGYAALPKDVHSGDSILLDDGQLELRVIGVSATDVETEVVRGGALRERAGVNLPGVQLSTPAFTPKDEGDLRFGLEQGVDMVAMSFVRSAKDAKPVREAIARGGRHVPLLAKVEKPEALYDLDHIMDAFDGVMVARGDLGVELSAERVPVAQKRIIALANDCGKPVITATQMLESMTRRPQPTRAEASDVANAVFDGTDAVMLSGETAIGDHPVATVAAMDRIVREAETVVPAAQPSGAPRDEAHAVVRAAAGLAVDVGAQAIAAFTRSGQTATLASKLRTALPVYALCEREEVARQLALWRGVAPLVVERLSNDEPTSRMRRELLAHTSLGPGATVVVVGSAPEERPARTNFIRLLTL